MVPKDRFVLLDHDQADANPQRTAAALDLAQRHGIQIIWQRPCFEALVLRHLPGCATRQPQTTADADRSLRKEWPEYLKPMTSRDLAKKIDRDAVLRVAEVEPELSLLFKCIRLVR